MPSCVLCELIAHPSGNALLLHQGSDAITVLHDDWSVLGHAMVVSRAHVEHSSELEPATAAAFFQEVQRAERALLRVIPAERVFVMKLGIAVPHLHYHLYPFSRSATRDDFLAAVTLQTRNEPEESARQQLLTDLRASFP